MRINRMMLGVSVPVAAFCERVFGAPLVDVDEPKDTDGVDVLVVGRQRLKDTGVYTFAHDIIPRCLAFHQPDLLIPVIPDRYEVHRYARDLGAWQKACNVGVAVVVFELGVLRELKETGHSDDDVATLAKKHQQEAKKALSPASWFTGKSLG